MSSLSHDARALERHAATRRIAGAVLLDVEEWERWGPKDDPASVAEKSEEARHARDEKAAATAALEAMIARLREHDPASLLGWAEAHGALLEDVLARDGLDPTTRSVAAGELEAWRGIARRIRSHDGAPSAASSERPRSPDPGGALFVDENVRYVPLDERLYRALFGFGPWERATAP